VSGWAAKHRNRLARRLVVTKYAFTVGWLSILVALLGAGEVVRAIPPSAGPEVGQIVTPDAPVSSDLVSALADVPPAGDSGPPLILTYHEISPTEDLPYTITPTRFAEHMRLLHEAGYRTIRAADLVAWMNGKPMPPRSVLLTFDDGTIGIWRYADPILARYGFTGTAFVITSYPGRGPRYLEWDQIAELTASGRWDIGSHTRAGHRYVATSGDGADGAFLTSRAWVETERRRETRSEYRERVTRDLEGSIVDLQAHGVSRPALFSFPFSAATSSEPDLTRFLTDLTNRLFSASMLDDGTGGVTTPAEKARRQLRRLSVQRDYDAERFVAEVIQSSPLPAGGTYRFADRDGWRANSSEGSVAVDRSAVWLKVPARTWTHVEYRPTRTVFWQDYSVATTVTGLDLAGDTSAGVTLWTGTPRQVTVSVSAGWIRVTTGTPGKILYSGRTPRSAKRHDLMVSLARGRLAVAVDGAVVVRNRSVSPGYGGVGLFASARQGSASIRFSDGEIGPPRRLT
jgi:poly-beta-1,6-N-acetyl-D-glucosamine N-deacetylase